MTTPREMATTGMSTPRDNSGRMPMMTMQPMRNDSPQARSRPQTAMPMTARPHHSRNSRDVDFGSRQRDMYDLHHGSAHSSSRGSAHPSGSMTSRVESSRSPFKDFNPFADN